jgi:hypothetical protein
MLAIIGFLQTVSGEHVAVLRAMEGQPTDGAVLFIHSYRIVS